MLQDTLRSDAPSSKLSFPSNIDDEQVYMSFFAQNDRMTIFLPSNTNIQLNASGDYGSTSDAVGDLSSKAAGALKDLISGATRGYSDNVFAKAGYTNNPNTITTFNGNTVRTFQFDFKFIPKSKEDSEAIDQIVKAFYSKIYAGGKGTGFLSYPTKWKIQYKSKGKDLLKFLPKYHTCFLEGVNITHNSEANIFHKNLAPLETNMQLTFRESRVLTAEDIQELEDTGYIEEQQLESIKKLQAAISTGDPQGIQKAAGEALGLKGDIIDKAIAGAKDAGGGFIS